MHLFSGFSLDPSFRIPPGKGLIVYDSACVLCSSLVSYLLKADRQKKLLFATFSSSVINRVSEPGLAHAPESLAFISGNTLFTESEAAIRIAEEINWKPALIRLIKLFPRWMRNFVYRIIAKNRYRWFGKTNACIITQPEDKDRFF